VLKAKQQGEHAVTDVTSEGHTTIMNQSRRTFIGTGSLGLSLLGQAQAGADTHADHRRTKDYQSLESDLQVLFEDLPDRKAFKIWAPATKDDPEFVAKLHSRRRLFSASTNKALIACERFRQLDSPDVAETLANNAISLDQTVWSLGSTVFNPPALTGTVSERTAMESMITHSDNTGTDMILKSAGHDKVRQLITSIGLSSTMIPDSTRALFAYIYGAPDYLSISWDEIVSLVESGATPVHPALNNVETLASSADDLVSFFSRALEGKFFRYRETLQEFRRILSLGDITYLVPFPLGASVFGKAGYYDVPGEHAYCISGGMYFPDRWVYFAMILNWDDPKLDDSETVAAFYRTIRNAVQLIQDALGN
jgi:beta-lactamase class A